jgi:hypothetical protein
LEENWVPLDVAQDDIRKALVLYGVEHGFPKMRGKQHGARMLIREEWKTVGMLRVVLGPLKLD